MSEQASNPAEATPLPRIVIDRGAATPEEIATLLVLFAAASGGDMSTDCLLYTSRCV